MFPVEKIEQDGQAGAKFTADGLDVEVTFATTGEVAGHIKLARQAICDRPLANASRTTTRSGAPIRGSRPG